MKTSVKTNLTRLTVKSASQIKGGAIKRERARKQG